MRCNFYTPRNLGNKFLALCLYSISGLLFLGGVAGCGNDKPQKQSSGIEHKTPAAQKACQNAAIIGEMSLSGQYIFDLAQCASNRTDSSEESLGDLLQLLNQLEPDGIQQLLDFALQPASTTGLVSERTYPYLTLINYILGRGATEEKELSSVSLQSERFDTLQTFLMSIDPKRSIQLIKDWQQSGILAQMLKHLSTYLKLLKSGQLSFLTRELIVGETVRDHALPLLLRIITEQKLGGKIEQVLKIDATHSIGDLSQTERNSCLENWLITGSSTRDDTCAALSGIEPGLQKTGPQRFQATRDRLSEKKQNQLSDLIAELIDAYASFEDEQRESISQRLFTSAEQLVGQHSKLLRNLTAILNQISQLQSSDLNLIKDAAEKLLEPNYDPTLNKLRAKIGESKLSELVAGRLESGFELSSCQNLVMAPLLQATEYLETGSEHSEGINALNLWLKPNPLCGGIPPLTALIGESLGLRFSLDCSQSSDGGSAPCVEIETESLKDLLNAQLNTHQLAPLNGEDQSRLLQFIQASLVDLKWNLQNDVNFLFAIGFAKGPVQPAIIEKIENFILERASEGMLSIDQIAAVDLELSRNDEFKNLKIDFIENLILRNIDRLSAMAYQFEGLLPRSFPPQDFSYENKAARVFSGTYTFGPYENMLEKSAAETLLKIYSDDNILALKERHPSQFSQFIHRMTSANAIFKNPGVSREQSDLINATVSGSNILNYLAFSNAGELALVDNGIIKPTQALTPDTGRDDTNFGLWKSYLYNSGLITKDLPVELTKPVETWASGLYQSLFAAQDQWLATLNSPTSASDLISPEFFETEAYQSSELRVIVSYLLQNYAKSAKILPKNAQYTGSDQIDDSSPIRGFFNASYLSSPYEPKKPWSVYSTLFPKVLTETDDYAQLRSSLLPSFEIFQSDPAQVFDVKGYGYRRKLSDFSPNKFSEAHKLWSSLNLLSFTQSKSASFPQPAIGVGSSLCKSSSDATETIACAIEITSDRGLQQDYLDLQNLMALNLDQIFCPLIASDRFGNPKVWQNELKLKLPDNAGNAARICEQFATENWSKYEWPEEYRSPDWMITQILNDILTLGRSPSIHSSLKQAATMVRLSKIRQLAHGNLANSARVRKLLFETPITWGSFEAARKLQKEKQAAGFESNSPGLIFRYLNLLESGITKELYEAYLINLARTTEDGSSRDPVTELLQIFIDTQIKFAANNSSALSLAIELARKLADDPYLNETVGHMILHTASSQSYDFFGRDLPLAVQGLFGQSFDWNDHGLHLLQSLTSRENLMASGQLRSLVSVRELTSSLSWLNDTTADWGESEEIAEVVGALLELLIKQASVWQENEQNFAADNWEMLLTNILQFNFSEEEQSHWYTIWKHYYVKFAGIANIGQGSIESLVKPSLSFVWSNLPDMLDLHFKADTTAKNEERFWNKLALEILAPLEENDPDTRQSAYTFLSDPAFGLGQPALWESLISSQTSRTLIDSSIGVLSRATHSTWVNGLTQSADLISSANKMLSFFDQKAEWKSPEKDIDLQQTLGILQAYSANERDLLEKQIDLIQHWFDGEASEIRIP